MASEWSRPTCTLCVVHSIPTPSETSHHKECDLRFRLASKLRTCVPGIRQVLTFMYVQQRSLPPRADGMQAATYRYRAVIYSAHRSRSMHPAQTQRSRNYSRFLQVKGQVLPLEIWPILLRASHLSKSVVKSKAPVES